MGVVMSLSSSGASALVKDTLNRNAVKQRMIEKSVPSQGASCRNPRRESLYVRSRNVAETATHRTKLWAGKNVLAISGSPANF